MRLSVVIPTHDRIDKLALTLDHLAAQSVPSGWEVLVVANRCADSTVAHVQARARSFPVDLRLVEEPRQGAAAARNAGARLARGTNLMLLDDDILVEPDCVARLLQDRADRPDAWYVGQVLPLPEHRATPFGTFRAALMPPTPTNDPVVEVEWFASGIALVPTQSLLALGGYDESFAGAALEDADLVIRAIRAGHRVFYDPRLTSHHNDWAGTAIRDFCRRQRLHCATAPMLDRRFGAIGHPWSKLITGNRPPSWSQDTPFAFAKKLGKQGVSLRMPLAGALALAELLEKGKAPPWALWPVYRAAIAGSMYAGYRQGLQRLASSRP